MSQRAPDPSKPKRCHACRAYALNPHPDVAEPRWRELTKRHDEDLPRKCWRCGAESGNLRLVD